MTQTLVIIFVIAGFVWAAAGSILQIRGAHGGGRKDYSRRDGEPLDGVVYNFTRAMLPGNKESIRRHPFKFGIGLAMHFGVFLCLASVILCLIQFKAGMAVLGFLSPLYLLSLAAGIYLLVRRMITPDLQAMSYPDDFVSILLSCGWVALGALTGLFLGDPIPFLIYSGGLLFYMPLGKLRHAVFFFVARWDFGRRLGYRGVYPPSSAKMGTGPSDG